MNRVAQLPTPRTEIVKFNGGLDIETPRWEVMPGKVRDAQNWEVAIEGGYTDIEGYERFDGQARPADAQYAVLEVLISGSFTVGDEITQQVTGATASVIFIDELATPNYLVLTNIVGIFDDTNAVEVASVVEGTALSIATVGGAASLRLDAIYKNLAADFYRALIAPVPGSGNILGVVMYGGNVWAFRNDAPGMAAALYGASAAGWVAVDLGDELSFSSGGTYEISEGDTLTGASSAATATVARVVIESGAFSTGDAAGRLILTAKTGTFGAENLDVGANNDVATITADSAAISLLPNGRYEFYIENFGGQIDTLRLYGCDKVNRGFEFDGTTFVPIATGMVDDTPNHVIVHKGHLFFAFGGSAQHSAIGNPYSWSVVLGAGEIATGDTIVGFMQEPGEQAGSALGIYNRNTVHMLYGSSAADWNLVRYRRETGAIEYSLQQVGTTFFLDDRGITNLTTTQAFGNFVHATMSAHIQTRVNQKKNLVAASSIAREKSQYRLFCSDGSGFYMTLHGKKLGGIMPVLFPDAVTCIHSSEDTEGRERSFFGSTNGMVYELDRGTSFDGENKESYMIFHFNFTKTIRWIKRFLDVTFEAYGTQYSEYYFSYQLDYATTKKSQPGIVTKALPFDPSQWDEVVWDNFTWDGVALKPSTNKLSGSGENVSFIIRKNSDFMGRNHFNGAFIRYLLRRLLRND